MSAQDELTAALVALASAGYARPPCGDPDASVLWTSDDAGERAQAARWCDGCPIVCQCAAAAEETGEQFGVWGGVDRSPRPGRPRGRSKPPTNPQEETP